MNEDRTIEPLKELNLNDPEPGVYEVCFKTYTQINAVNWSSLKPYLKSPFHAALVSNKAEPYQDFGRQVHCLFLEGRVEYDNRFATYQGKVRRGKEFESFKALHPNKVIQTATEREEVQLLNDQLTVHPLSAAIPLTCICEVVFVWINDLGIKCKAMMDAVQRNHEGVVPVVYDLKTTTSADESGFAREAAKYWYHAQMAWYREGIEKTFGKLGPATSLKIIAAEKGTGAIARYTFTDAALFAGLQAAATALNRFLRSQRDKKEGNPVVGLNENKEVELISFFPPQIPGEAEIFLDYAS
tara:strand:- start:334 stop:1230 length:897 start_codon:yes stop_codon:yes gene_type:complete